MISFDAFAIRFLFASLGCLAAGLALWGATALVRRVLPALAMQRSAWLLAQLAIAATFIVLLMPHASQLHMLPVFEVDMSAAAAVVPAAPGHTAVAAPQDAPRSALAWVAAAWVLAYAAGLLWTLGRLWHGQRALARLMRCGVQVAPGTIEVDAAIPPMLVGLVRPRLLLPLSLRTIDPLQRALIVAHEMTHWRRGDPWCLGLGTVLQALCWFNPAMRALRAGLSWAQELGCDRDVLRGRPQGERKAYAAALVAQLRVQHHAELAFGGEHPDTLAARVALIRTPGLARYAGPTRCVAVAVVVLAFAGNLALQPALAWSSAPSALDCTLMLDAASGRVLVEQGRCDVRVSPASTFNIAVSLMGYDAGILRDAHTPALPFKAGYVDWQPSWRATTDPTSWIRNSTVWYAQQVTTRLGENGLRAYVGRFDYGNQDLSSGVLHSWIGASLQISAIEQAGFLRKVANRALPVSPHAYDMTAQLLRLPTTTNGWDVYGKTGTATLVRPDGSEDDAQSYGWFVGWASKNGRTVVFARQTFGATHPQRAAGPLLKETFLHALPATLDALHLNR